MHKQSAIAGSYSEEPYNWLNANVTNVALEKDGANILPPYTLNFPQSDYSRLYIDSLIGSGCVLSKAGTSFLDKTAFANGYTRLIYILDNFDEFCTMELRGPTDVCNLRLRMAFDASTKRDYAIVLNCFLHFKREFTISYEGEVLKQ